MITTAHKEWEELQEIMTKEKPTQFAVLGAHLTFDNIDFIIYTFSAPPYNL